MKSLKLISIALLSLFVSCATPQLDSTHWQLSLLNGEEVVGDEPDSFTLDFGVENKVSGKGACNRMMGGYAITGRGEIKFEQLATTMMFCPNLDKENEFLRELEAVTHFKLDGDMLRLYNADNVEVITLKSVTKEG